MAGALVERAEAGRGDLRDLPAARPEQPRPPLVRGVGRGDLPAGLPVAPLADSWIGFVVYRIVFGEGERVPDEAEIAASVDAALRLRLTPSAAGRSRRVAVPVTHRTHRTAPSVPTGSTGPTGQRPRRPPAPSTHRTASSLPSGPAVPPWPPDSLWTGRRARPILVDAASRGPTGTSEVAPMTVVDLAALGESFTRDPYPVYARLRARGPVHRIRMPEGNTEAWLVVGHEAGRAVLTDPTLTKDWSKAAPALGLGAVSAGPHMLRADPPDHTRLRKLVAREFTPRRVEQLAPRIQRTTDGLVDTMLAAPGGRVDLVEALSFPLPITVICDLLGVPDLDRRSFRTWSNDALGATDPADRTAAATAMVEYLTKLVDDKRRHLGDDLLSALIHGADEDGDSLSPEELLGMAWLLLVAGHETTVNLISNGVLALLTHPEQLAALRADPGLMENAVEEMLRYDSPVETPTYRFTTAPLTIGDTTVPGGGELVLVALADAGRDPARFTAPDDFDIRRDARGHLAFGHGIHYCLGAPLARLEARIALGTLLERCGELALDIDPAAVTWRPGMLIRGPFSLPVRVAP
ncbi:cytochrome P450 [Streptomyces griseoviridis]|uniref:Cytochrome P450 n=2 Tax=Streptomyces griseoviridis TaxID=45398 RepID=A0ABT9LRI3_STRGD|nr:cytochrome P450 [Streptomyces griseoviridis]